LHADSNVVYLNLLRVERVVVPAITSVKLVPIRVLQTNRNKHRVSCQVSLSFANSERKIFSPLLELPLCLNFKDVEIKQDGFESIEI
jgi:hypothetical protein